MFVSKSALDLFHIGRGTVEDQRAELAKLTTENNMLRAELATTKANFDWLRIRVNALEIERAQLMDKAYGVKVPVPEIARVPNKFYELGPALFEDVGDTVAKEIGLPHYGTGN